MTRGRRARREPLAVIGAGGHARVVIDIAELSRQYRVAGVFDDDPTRWGGTVAGCLITGGLEEFLSGWRAWCRTAVVAIGDNHARGKCARRLLEAGVRLATLVHPAAVVARDAVLGPGTVVMAGAVVNPGAAAGPCAVINTAASVDHDCSVGECAFIAPGVRLAGGVRVGDFAFVGTGASVIPGRTIGRNARVGAGAVVIRDVPDGATVVGVPAHSKGTVAAP